MDCDQAKPATASHDVGGLSRAAETGLATRRRIACSMRERARLGAGKSQNHMHAARIVMRCWALPNLEALGRKNEGQVEHGNGLEFARPDDDQPHQQHEHHGIADRNNPSMLRFHLDGRILCNRSDDQRP
jgi:hypothetical protein